MVAESLVVDEGLCPANERESSEDVWLDLEGDIEILDNRVDAEGRRALIVVSLHAAKLD